MVSTVTLQLEKEQVYFKNVTVLDSAEFIII